MQQLLCAGVSAAHTRSQGPDRLHMSKNRCGFSFPSLPQDWTFCQLVMKIFVKYLKKKNTKRVPKYFLSWCLGSHTAVISQTVWPPDLLVAIEWLLCMSQSAETVVLSPCWFRCQGGRIWKKSLLTLAHALQANLASRICCFYTYLFLFQTTFSMIATAAAMYEQNSLLHWGGGRGLKRHHMSDKTFWVMLGVVILQKEVTVWNLRTWEVKLINSFFSALFIAASASVSWYCSLHRHNDKENKSITIIYSKIDFNAPTRHIKVLL